MKKADNIDEVEGNVRALASLPGGLLVSRSIDPTGGMVAIWRSADLVGQ